MREILFRGIPKDKSTFLFFQEVWKDCCDGNFVKGSLIVSKGRYYICVSAMCQINSTINNGITSMIEVIPETVGQYTGLTDKNGKKIFEGDIVVTNKFGSPNRKYVIVYDDEIATYIGEGKQGCCRYFTTFSGDADAFEVIGNIHDNPELLKGDDTDA